MVDPVTVHPGIAVEPPERVTKLDPLGIAGPSSKLPFVRRFACDTFGTQSANGSRFAETMLTVIETCRQQRRNAFDYLTAAVKAHLAGQPAPSLLPRV